MIKQILDLHIHSKYSRACSRELELPKIAAACGKKGIDIVATGDFTHPAWFRHIKETLVEVNDGIYAIKSQFPISPDARSGSRLHVGTMTNDQSNPNDQSPETKFILSTEISCIYSDKGKVRRLHLLILAPNIEAAAKLIQEFEKRNVNLKSDGRPIMGFSGKEILQILLDIDSGFALIPAHAWTPWFSVFGSKSGYDSLEECFEELAPHVRAIETGLSSDPPMNHRLSALDNITLVSNSDAHSLDNLGREANVFQFERREDAAYENIARIIKGENKKDFLYTIEFYPEEGKYHYDGHSSCKICLSPEKVKKIKEICPVCGKKLTIGVSHRVADLVDREFDSVASVEFIPHKYIVPLREVIGQVFLVGPKSKKVAAEYDRMIRGIGNEFFVLLEAGEEEIVRNISDKSIWIAINNMRKQKVRVEPGYDGVFGKIDVLGDRKNFILRQKNLL